MASETEIANLALSHLGNRAEISHIENDRSQEGLICRRYFDLARDVTLRDFAWPFATMIAALGLVAENPNSEWGYSYRYPSDCLRVKRILNGMRNDTPDNVVIYKIARDSQGTIILTDQANAELEFVFREMGSERYPPDFVMAMSFRLAAYVAPKLTGGDPFKAGERAIRLYEYEILKAQATALNEEQSGSGVDSELIRSRG